ncbi:MAG TPA: type II toxin-antitoxin system SpoIISA family toxin [Virgibacillus sp.]|nr:type II toxin-antitoxin system SpoIISA family toxin [Virgibacillus sp.]
MFKSGYYERSQHKKTNRYKENLYHYHKTLYFIFVMIIGALSLFHIIDKKDWQYLLIGAAMIVFIDIAIFSTPPIKKIWNTEFGVIGNLP